MALDLENLCGWRHDHAEEAFKSLRHRFMATFPLTKGPAVKGPPIWDYAKQVYGKHLPTWFQETGDCVSMGATNAGQYLSCLQIGLLRKEQKFRLWYPPYIYGTSRIDIGRGQLGRGAGSTGAWAVEAMRKLGVLFMDDKNVPSYSGSLADSWGYRGVPDEFKALAKDNPVLEAAPVNSTEQIKLALDNYWPCTFAISWVYGQEAYEYKGYRIMRRTRYVGGHQVCLLYWNDDIDGAFCLNSWGANSHSGPTSKLDEPPGGAYILRADLEKDLRDSMCEIYALKGFEGDPTEEWWGLFGGPT